MNKDLLEKTQEIAAAANVKKHAEELSIPVIDGFQLMDNGNPQTIFFALDGQGFSQQMTGDGPVPDNEGFEERVKLVRENVVKFMKDNGDSEAEKHYFFLKDYDNGVFKFKIYVQDMIFQGHVIRMINAFFLEPKYRDFYQMTISVGPFPHPTTSFTMGSFNGETEPISGLLLDMMQAVLNEMKYK